ncbi:MAG TPA: flagellar hook-associated protein FlgL [Polyangiaceae bacterium]|nr:flagellar hook-associated protein FlgL [Polyangiaceae bacterium]
MRVTEQMRYDSVANNLSQLSSRQAKAAQEAQTGVRVNLPSDDPIAAAQLARLSASQSQVAARRSTISSVRGDAELAESSLQQASDLMASAKELAMQGGNGSLGATERATLAQQVKDIRDQLIGIANTKGSSGYLFAGSATETQPFSTSGAFNGNDDAHLVDIGNSTPSAVNASGAKAFTSAGGRDVFGDLDALYNALSTNDSAAIATSLDGLDRSRSQITTAQTTIGITLNKLDASDSVQSAIDLQNSKSMSDIGAADPAKAYSALVQLNNALQQSVSVGKSILDLAAFKQF